LRRLEEEARALPAGAVVGHALRATGLLPLSAVAFEGAQRVANLRKLAASAASIAADGRRSLHEVLDAIEEERASILEADSPLADEGSDAVRVLTVHAAKGLESRVVFVADLAREPARAGSGVPVRVASAPGGAPLAAISLREARTAARVWIDLENAEHDRAEEVRVLYVAATRARDRLVLLCAPPRPGREPGAWTKALAPWGYDATSLPEDGETLLDGAVLHRRMVEWASGEPPSDGNALLETVGAETAYLAALDRARAAARPPLGRPSGPSDAPSRPEPPGPGDPRTIERSVARGAGTAIHRFLESWDGDGGSAALPRLERLARSAAEELDCDPDEVVREAAEVLRSFLEGPLAERLRAIRPMGREVPVLSAEGERAWRGVIDLLYRDTDDRVVVADYKTDADPDESAIEKYRLQLGVYRDAVRRALGLSDPPAGELWMLRSGRIVRF
jgi:ATP-dependent exoDNAse (exonuclease V) beta subunit